MACGSSPARDRSGRLGRDRKLDAAAHGVGQGDRSELPGRADVRPPAGAVVDPVDVDHPDRVDPDGQGDEPRASDGCRFPLGAGNVDDRHRVRRGGEFPHPGPDLVPGAVGGPRGLEVNDAPEVAHGRLARAQPSHRKQHRAHEVLGGMEPHVAMAPGPVDLPPDRLPHVERRGTGPGGPPEAVHDGAAALHDLDDRDDPALGTGERPAVARLAAAGRVEEGPVEHDPPGRQGRDPPLEGAPVGLLDLRKVEEVGHGAGTERGEKTVRPPPAAGRRQTYLAGPSVAAPRGKIC